MFTALAAISTSASADTITVNVGGTQTAISELIYGYNDWTRSSTTESLNYTLERMGGNRMTGYNWENNASNAGTDYYNYSDNNIVSSVSSSLQSVPGEGLMLSIDHAQDGGRPSLITLPLAGYVAADMNGIVSSSEVAPSSRWKQVVLEKGSSFSLSPSTSDSYVYVDEEINFLLNKYGTAANGGVLAYSMDNEPALWASTHPLLHPDVATVSECISQNIAVAEIVKDMDSSALVFGPALYGWSAYYWLGSASDWSSYSGTYSSFIEAYLDAMYDASVSAGVRLLDALDIHYYPEATGNDVRVTTNDDNSSAVVEARLQAPRSLWDSTYTETSWITTWCTYGPIELIPLVQDMIDTYYPNTGLAITEYDFGGHTNYSGGLAQADVLGIFGEYGVYAACFWGTVEGYVIPGFKIFRNYDGNNSTFGDISIPTTNPSASNYSTFASIDSDTGNVHLIAINKTSSSKSVTIALSNTSTSFSSASVYGFSESGGSSISSYTSVSNISGNSFSYTLPAHSVLHFIIAD